MSDEISDLEEIFSSDTLNLFENDRNDSDRNSSNSLNPDNSETVIETTKQNIDESDSLPTFSDEEKSLFETTDKTIINVLQGFYAKITPETPQNIVDLFIDGLGPCVCIILTDVEHSYMFLAHADVAGMNVCDPEIGIPAWIRDMKDQGIEESSILLYCGIDNGIEEGDYPYEILVKDALSVNGIENIGFNIFDRAPLKLTAGSGIILRKGAEKLIYKDQISYKITEIENNHVYLNLSSDPVVGLGFLLREEQQIKIQDLDDIKRWRLDPIEFNERGEIIQGGVLWRLRFNIAKEANLTYNELADIPFPPICCFDGKKFKTTKELEEQYIPIIAQYEDKFTEISITSKRINKNKNELQLAILTKFYSSKNKLTRQGENNFKNVLTLGYSQQI